MSGEIAPVIDRSWRDIWGPLTRSAHAPSELLNELLAAPDDAPEPPKPPPSPSIDAFDEAGTEVIDPSYIALRDSYQRAVEQYTEKRAAFEFAVAEGDARPLFKQLLKKAGATEAKAMSFLESTDDALEEYDHRVRATYRRLLSKFLVTHNLGYTLDHDFRLHPSMPAVFSRVMHQIRETAYNHPHTAQMFSEFEQALFDLRHGRTEARLKSCLGRQFNLLEALGRQCPGVDGNTLGKICNQLTWPQHDPRCRAKAKWV